MSEQVGTRKSFRDRAFERLAGVAEATDGQTVQFPGVGRDYRPRTALVEHAPALAASMNPGDPQYQRAQLLVAQQLRTGSGTLSNLATAVHPLHPSLSQAIQTAGAQEMVRMPYHHHQLLAPAQHAAAAIPLIEANARRRRIQDLTDHILLAEAAQQQLEHAAHASLLSTGALLESPMDASLRQRLLLEAADPVRGLHNDLWLTTTARPPPPAPPRNIAALLTAARTNTSTTADWNNQLSLLGNTAAEARPLPSSATRTDQPPVVPSASRSRLSYQGAANESED